MKLGQFDLDGLTFGDNQGDIVVLTSGWEPGNYEIRDQDVPAPQADRLLMGRDLVTPGSMTFHLLLRHPVNVRPLLTQLATAWRADRVRSTPGALSALRWNLDGTPVRVYGRPRAFAVEPQEVTDPTMALVTASFQLAEAVAYSDTSRSVTLDLVTGVTGAGLTLPAMLPWHLSESRTQRDGVITVDSVAPVPFTVVIRGPVVGSAGAVRLWGPGWSLPIVGTLLEGSTLTINTRDQTAIWGDGQAAYGAIPPSASLSMRLPPGPTEVSFDAADPSGTSSATITWRDAAPIL